MFGKRKEENIIIIDEIGDVGENTPDDPTFTYSATITKKPTLFEYVAIKFRTQFKERLVDGELKASNLYPNQREEVLKDISELNPEIHAIHINKNANDNPKWWSYKGNRGWVFKETLGELMDETFSSTDEDDFKIIIDYNNELKNDVGKNIVELLAERKEKNVIECIVEDSNKRGKNKQIGKEYSDLIQANDVIPREVRDREMGKTDGHELNINTKRLTYNNVRRDVIGEDKQEFARKNKHSTKQRKN